METHFNPGSLVAYHDRDWVVLPSSDEELLLLKPLGGTDHEIKGVYKPLLIGSETQIKRSTFPLPTENDLGNFGSARLLYNAARLAFRNGAGPFRSMGKLSFRPRSYQLVPLIMALKLNTVRLLIADGVGIGKTIEALLIVRELLDRGDIQRFAIVCLPHLCDQWHQELRDKFGIEAALIRSSTVKRLEKQLGPDETVFQHFPFQVISIDYIKQKGKKEVFLNHTPELVIVDEAHTCAQPSGGRNSQQRHALIKEVARRPDQHLLLLTATPHSGKPEEFQSILGLLKPEFEPVDLTTASDEHKQEVACHFVQRRRKNVEHWLDETTLFPTRIADENPYKLSTAYQQVFDNTLAFARSLATTNTDGPEHQNRMRYYMAIGLIRGVMSSPAAGEAMLLKRQEKQRKKNQEEKAVDEIPADEHVSDDLLLDVDLDQEDQTPTEFTDRSILSRSEKDRLSALTKAVTALKGLTHDTKAKAAHDCLRDWLTTDNVIVFCRYIQTANYLKEVLEKSLGKVFKKELEIALVTSELSDEERKAKVEAMKERPNGRKLLIATDCMSEGINLQEQFSGVLHYDLPWNPNRLEQREGRIDRFGQSRPQVRTVLLYGEDNPMDGTVLNVLLRKARNIRDAIGISVPFPKDSKTIMDAVLMAVLLKPQTYRDGTQQIQMDFGADDEVQKKVAEVDASFKRLQAYEEQITSVFAQNSIQPQELLPYLRETETILGDETTVEQFVRSALPELNTRLTGTAPNWRLNTTNLGADITPFLPDSTAIDVSFQSPPPKGSVYLHRNHPFVEHLCRKLLEAALVGDDKSSIARASVFRTDQVRQRTTLFLLRVRNVIASASGSKELVAEEMLLWGMEGDNHQQRPELQTIELLERLRPTQQVTQAEQTAELHRAITDYKGLRASMNELAINRARYMVEGHKRFSHALHGNGFKEVEPVLPPDVLGIYVALPEIQFS